MEAFIMDQIREMNLLQLIAIGGMFWFFYNRLNNKIIGLDTKFTTKIEDLDTRLSAKIEALDVKLNDKIESLSKKIDRLDEKVTDIDRRVCRMEGAMHNKEGCVIKEPAEMRRIQ